MSVDCFKASLQWSTGLKPAPLSAGLQLIYIGQKNTDLPMSSHISHSFCVWRRRTLNRFLHTCLHTKFTQGLFLQSTQAVV